ncbi:uncharacterized protein LOC130655075 [Hydractinia symbiolongicarpus]|uniref:uncharacterized protein LOC130655075 n=1 Tax=Hydractinia symbiolongicarpus TaxID=13093 RepID=UPI002551180B|nr:uncharacterized protein LOC130655075 [Hydractinia symbiolongicarpus]
MLSHLIVFSTLVVAKAVYWKDVVKGKDELTICNKTFYEENFVKRDKSIPITYLNRTCNKLYNRTCFGKPGEVKWTAAVSSHKTGLLIYILVLNPTRFAVQNRGCWGTVLEVKKNGKLFSRYKNYKRKGRIGFQEECTPNTTYFYKVVRVPTGRPKEIGLVCPGECEKSLLLVMHKQLYEASMAFKCEVKLSIIERLKFVRPLCLNLNLTASERERITINGINASSCALLNPSRLLINLQSSSESSTPTLQFSGSEFKLLHGVIASVISVLCLAGCVFLLLLYKRKKKNKNHINHRIYQEEDAIQSQENLNEKETPSVMILNRPGCELLEIFLRDFAFILQSYGIEVKLALLEQNHLDAEGGIASYMQKYVNECDYILIMFSEKTEEHNKMPKHKPYEFTLKMLSGLAFHQNDCSRYLPLYLTSYEKVVDLLPSFLNSSTTFGYQLPKDVQKLIRRFTGKKKLKVTPERAAKDKYFLERMESRLISICENQHPHCTRENCRKGMLNASVENLSSIWPSTINSKWQSSQSLNSTSTRPDSIILDDGFYYEKFKLACYEDNNNFTENNQLMDQTNQLYT